MNLMRCMILICASLIIESGTTSLDDEWRCIDPDWFLCNNKRCLSHWFVCDGEDDCGDNSDEIDCPDSLEPKFHQDECDEFRCDSGDCLENERVCDGLPDCPDLSDENNCENRTISPEQCNNEINHFLCNNSRCILLNETCNGEDDCDDNSDEDDEECKLSEELCKNGIGCSHYCNKTPNGPVCSCPNGYKLKNNQSCIDTNECIENPSLCDQLCVNDAGTYHCECETGYKLQEDKKSCKVDDGEALMIFSATSEIRGLYLDSMITFPIVKNLQKVVGVTMDANHIYWSSASTRDQLIMRSQDDGTKLEVVAVAGVGSPKGVAIDWVTKNVYFTDAFWKYIGVCKSNGEYCTILICDGIEEPRGLVLDPMNARLLWSDQGVKPRISRARMDGKNVEALVTEDLGWPNGLAIDYPKGRLYWIDGKFKTIESINLKDGSDRRRVLQLSTESNPMFVSIMENRVYWSDFDAGLIESADKHDGNNRTVLMKFPERISGIDIYHSALKPKMSNPCESQPCSELCLLAPNQTYTCACTVDKKMSTDQKICNRSENKNELFITFGNTFIKYGHEVVGKPRIEETRTSKSMRHVAWNSVAKTLIANDELSKSIFLFDPSNGNTNPVTNLRTNNLGGIDFDYYGNNIYWSDPEYQRIVIHSMETGENTVLFLSEKPFDILVVPKATIMYVVFESENGYRIAKLSMDGRDEIESVVEKLRGPKISLAHDEESQRIFYSDEGFGKIGSFSIFGKDERIVRLGVEGIVSLVVQDRRIFWTLRNSSDLQWIDERDESLGKKSFSLGRNEDVPEMMDLVTVREINEDYHPCRKNNGGCSHVCLVPSSVHLLKYPSDVVICACPTGMILDSNQYTCSSLNRRTARHFGECSHCPLLC